MIVIPPSNKFITTEPLSKSGEAGEQLVWDGIQAAFVHRECIGYWRYPIFSKIGKFRKEPDIFIVDRELGLYVNSLNPRLPRILENSDVLLSDADLV